MLGHSPQDAQGRRSMIDFLVVSADLWLHFLHTQEKRGTKLSVHHHLDLSWNQIGRMTWQTYHDSLLAMFGPQTGLQLPPPAKLQPCFPGSSSLVSCCCSFKATTGLLQQSQRQPMGTGRPSVAQFQQSQRYKSGHWSLLRPWRTTFNRSQRNSGKPSGVSGGRCSTAAMHTIYGANGRLLTSNDTIVGRWKEYKDLLNFTNTYSEEETELDCSREGPSITGAEVTAVVKKLHSGRAPGVDEICPEYLKTLDIVGLSHNHR